MYTKSYAKINLGLSILSKMENGYHDLDMVMIPLKLHDAISFDFTNAFDSFVICDELPEATGHYNLGSRAVEKVRAQYNIKQRFDINIHKEIPVSAGLGGGSSNAAQVVRCVLKMTHKKVPDSEIIELCKSLGGDVPFFYYNKSSRVGGIGEKITFINPKIKYYVLLVKPMEGLSSKKVYEVYDSMPQQNGNIDALIAALESGDDEGVKNNMHNVLEAPAISLLPEIQKIKDMLKNDGLDKVMMTGSGSCVFALSTDKAFLKKIYHKYQKTNYQVVFTKML